MMAEQQSDKHEVQEAVSSRANICHFGLLSRLSQRRMHRVHAVLIQRSLGVHPTHGHREHLQTFSAASASTLELCGCRWLTTALADPRSAVSQRKKLKEEQARCSALAGEKRRVETENRNLHAKIADGELTGWQCTDG